MSARPIRVVDLSKSPAGGLVRRELPTPSAAKLRYADWFLRAGWSVTNTAYLFDIDPAVLGGLAAAA